MALIRALLLLSALSLGLPVDAQSAPKPDPDQPAPESAPQSGQPDDWSKKKCELYALIFRDALSLKGHEGLSPSFLNTNQRFIDAGCSGERTLCPKSEAELAFADLLTMMTMNEGMASTFAPFGCTE